MKVIEGLKKIKDLQRKASDLRNKVAQCSAYLDYETPLYADQKKQVSDWLQAHSDTILLRNYKPNWFMEKDVKKLKKNKNKMKTQTGSK